MTEAQKIVQAVGSAVTAQSEEIIDFLKQKGFKEVLVRFGQVARDVEPPRIKNFFTLSIEATVDPAEFLETDCQ